MQVSQAGMDLSKRFEGLKLRVYLDIAGIPTIGRGHRLLHPGSFPDGITESQADEIFLVDMRDAGLTVSQLVKVPITQGIFDALTDFEFNLGQGRLAGSTLLKDLNSGDSDAAAQQLLLWDHGCIEGKEVEIAALKARRAAEFELWTGKSATGSAAPAEV